MPSINELKKKSLTDAVKNMWGLDPNGLHGKKLFKTNRQKYTYHLFFPALEYSVHLPLCSDIVVLSDIKLVAEIHECMNVFLWSLDRYVRSI